MSSPKKKNHPPTMRDVAAKAGVSASAVSLALRGDRSISEPTRQRVLKVQRDLGYKINQHARRFVRKTRGASHEGPKLESLAFVVLNASFASYATVLEGVVRESSDRNIEALPFLLKITDEALPTFPQRLKEHALDGMIVTGTVTHRTIEVLSDLKIPFVVFGTYELSEEFDLVDFDVAHLVHQGVERLLQNGHRHIAYIDSLRSTGYSHAVKSAWEDVLRKNQLPVRHQLSLSVDMDSPRFDWQDPAARFLAASPRPTALFASDVRIATGLLTQLRVSGLKIPKALQVVCMNMQPLDASPRWHDSIVLDGAEAGRLAVARLQERIEFPTLPPNRSFIRQFKWLEQNVA